MAGSLSSNQTFHMLDFRGLRPGDKHLLALLLFRPLLPFADSSLAPLCGLKDILIKARIDRFHFYTLPVHYTTLKIPEQTKPREKIPKQGISNTKRGELPFR